MKQNTRQTALRWLLGKSRRQLPAVVVLGLFNMLAAGLSLWLALLSKDLIDAANVLILRPLPQDVWQCISRPEIAVPAIRVLCAIVAQVVLNILISNLRVRAAGRLEMSLKQTLFCALMHAEYTAVHRYHSGELMNRLTADAALVAQNFVGLLPSALSMFTRLVGGIAVLAVISPWFTVGVLAVGVMVVFLSRFYGGYAKKFHKICQETDGKTRSFMQEVLSNLLCVKAFSNQSYMEERLDALQQHNFRERVRRNMVSNFGNTGAYLLLTTAYYVMLLCGVLLMIAGTITVGTLAALLQIFEQLQAPLRSASGLLTKYYSTIASAERLWELERLEKEKIEPLPLSKEELFRSFTQLSIRQLTFAYDEATPVLNGVDMTVKRGEITALVGESGIGKSTVMKLILAILTPQTGEMSLICGEQKLKVNAATRDFFAYVPQGNTVLSGTLRENVAFFRPHISDKRIEQALHLACLDDFLQSLPEGLDALIGEHGYGVSEGQAQRIAIARALLNEAPVLLLDECTSALDPQTEKQLLGNIRELTDKAVLMVSHKSSAVQGCNTVLRLQNGKLFVN